MDPNSRLAGRTAAPPAVAASRSSNENKQTRSSLNPFKRLKGLSLTRFIRASQTKTLSRFKGLRAVSKTGDSIDIKDASLISASPFKSFKSLASTWSTTSQPLSTATTLTPPEALSSVLSDQTQTELGSMPPVGSTASQKRKQDDEHDDAPSRTKTRPTSNADDLERWINEQNASASPTSTGPDQGAGEDSSDGPRLSIMNSRSSTAEFDQAQQMPPPPIPHAAEHERRDSAATTSNSTNRESIFSTYTVRTGLTSPSDSTSELSLTNNNPWRPSRTSSYLSKVSSSSPRSSIASSVPSPAITFRTLSGNSINFVEDYDIIKNPLPIPNLPVQILPVMDRHRSSPVQTVLGLDLRNKQSAIVVDQMVKMGHIAQERRFHSRAPADITITSHGEMMILDLPKPMASPCAINDNLTPIKEAASDDGSSITPKAIPDESEDVNTAVLLCNSPEQIVPLREREQAKLMKVVAQFESSDLEMTRDSSHGSNDSGYASILDGGRESTTRKKPAERHHMELISPPTPNPNGLVVLAGPAETPDHTTDIPTCTINIRAPNSMQQSTLPSKLTLNDGIHHHGTGAKALDNLASELQTLQSDREARNEDYPTGRAFALEASTPTHDDDEAACQGSPGSPDSEDRQSVTMRSVTMVTDGQRSRGGSLTPATSVADVSEMTEAPSLQSEDFDDSVSEFTDYTEESLFEAVEAFDPVLFNPLVLSIIMAFNEDVLRLVLARVGELTGSNHGVTYHGNGEPSGSTPTSSTSNISSQGQGTGGQQRAGRKRPLNDDGDEARDDDEENERGKKPRPPTKEPSDPLQKYRKLACPFRKRYPETKWKYKACYGPGYDTVHRVKEHVYRNHDVPYCQRCHTTFVNPKALEEHLQADEGCVPKKGPLGHLGITPEQRVQLKSRKRGDGDVNQTEEDKWIKVYLLLFSVPRAEVPSPYYDLKECEEGFNPAAVRQFLQDDVPARVTRQLEERRLDLGIQSVQEQLPGIIRDCVGQACDNLPRHLFAPREQPSPVPASEPEPQQPSMTDAPASQNTAQIGAQFAVVEPQPTRDLATAQDQTVAEVAMGNATGLPAGYSPTDNHTGHHASNQMGLTAENLTQLPSIPATPNWPLREAPFENPFRGVWFPDPLENNPGQLGLGNGGSLVSIPPPAPPVFSIWGQPSAMLAANLASRSPAPADMPNNGGGFNGFEGFNFNFQGGNMPYNMPNAQFLHREGFPPDHNNNAFGHDPNQQRNYHPQ